MAKVKPKLNGRSNTIEVMPIMQEKEEKTGKNSGVDSRKNLKRKERHTNQHSIDGFIQFLFSKQQLYLDNLAQQQNNNQPVTNPNCNY